MFHDLLQDYGSIAFVVNEQFLITSFKIAANTTDRFHCKSQLNVEFKMLYLERHSESWI